YPGLDRGADDSAVLGWAGWDHGDQALALAQEVLRLSQTGEVEAEQATPLLAGLVELEPWLHQWHSEVNPEMGQSMAQFITDLIDQQLSRHQLTRSDLDAWRPPQTNRRRRSA